MDLWTSQTSDNPVFYVQYGHARLCSLGRKAEENGISLPEDLSTLDLGTLTHSICEVQTCHAGQRPEDAGKDVFISRLICRRDDL